MEVVNSLTLHRDRLCYQWVGQICFATGPKTIYAQCFENAEIENARAWSRKGLLIEKMPH